MENLATYIVVKVQSEYIMIISYWNIFVTQPASPLAAPSLSAVTELFKNSDSHTKQLLIATRITIDNIFNKIHSKAIL